MKKILSFLLGLFIVSVSFAQLENANWCFGYQARVNFLTVPPAVSTSVYTPYLNVSCPTVSGQGGQLLFYSDGANVYGSNHSVINNGDNIWGFNQLGQQSSVIVPKPGHPGIYYLFTIGATTIPVQGNEVGRGGIHYSVINLSTGTGYIDNTLKNVSLKNTSGTAMDYAFTDVNNSMFLSSKSRITTTLNNTGDKIWVTIIAVYGFQAPHTRVFYNYLVDVNGIGGVGDGTSPIPVVEDANVLVSRYVTSNPYKPASMKISPSGAKLCDAEDVVVNLYNYSQQYGTITHSTTITTSGADASRAVGYGVEFSPNSSKLYYTDNPNYIIQNVLVDTSYNGNPYGSIYQYDINTERLKLIYSHLPSQDLIQGLVPIPAKGGWGLQLAIDGKIYVSSGQNQYHLGAIKDPNDVYPDCHWDPVFLPLASGTFNGNQMPQWVHRATVNTIWPKVYDGIGDPVETIRVENGNVLAYIPINNMSNNMNHNGPVATGAGYRWVHYNNSTGATNWYDTQGFDCFTLSIGEVQFSGSYYVDATWGTTATSPGPTNLIVVEDNGTFVTKSGTALTVYGGSTTNAPTISGYTAVTIQKVVYNPATNHVFVQYAYSGGKDFLTIYTLGTTALTLTYPTIPYREIPDFFAGVNTLDEVFTSGTLTASGGVLQKFDYVNNTFAALGITNNSSLGGVRTFKQTAEDNILATKAVNDEIWCINTNTLTVKKISATLDPVYADPYIGSYFIDGNDVYIGGMLGLYGVTSLTIGNQTIPLVGTYSSFFTKFNLGDFNRPALVDDLITKKTKGLTLKANGNTNQLSQKNDKKETELLTGKKINLSPNPVNNILRVGLPKTSSETGSSRVSIINAAGVAIFTTDTKQPALEVNVSGFRPGLYHVEVHAGNGNRSIKTFVKE